MKVRARVILFDERTWWGIAKYGSSRVDFHATSVAGFQDGLNLLDRECDLFFNETGELFDVRLVKRT